MTLPRVAMRAKPAAVEGPDVIRAITAGILLLAAGLKAHQLATQPVASNSIFTYRWSLVTQVECEFVFGLWLLSGLQRRLTWVLAVGCFTFFAGVSLYKALSGEASCGCFGKVDVNPWYTLILDVGVVAALVGFPPDLRKADKPRSYRLRLAAVAALALIVGIPAGLVTVSYDPTTLGADAGMVGDGRIVLLEPEKWVGKLHPLARYIDIGDQLAKGNWILLLYHHDCPGCPEAIAKYEQKARSTVEAPGAPRIALIEVAPPHRGGRRLVGPNSPCILGKLSDVREWFVTTPAVITLKDGQVIAASEGRDG